MAFSSGSDCLLARVRGRGIPLAKSFSHDRSSRASTCSQWATCREPRSRGPPFITGSLPIVYDEPPVTVLRRCPFGGGDNSSVTVLGRCPFGERMTGIGLYTVHHHQAHDTPQWITRGLIPRVSRNIRRTRVHELRAVITTTLCTPSWATP